jgi:hypothetical protein
VIVAVIPVRVVQMPVHEVVRVVPVRHCLMSAILPVDVRFIMPGVELRSACGRVRRVHLDAVIVYVVAVLMMQVAVVNIIGMAIVRDCRVAAVRAVLMGMATLFLVRLGHTSLLSKILFHTSASSKTGTI